MSKPRVRLHIDHTATVHVGGEKFRVIAPLLPASTPYFGEGVVLDRIRNTMLWREVGRLITIISQRQHAELTMLRAI